MNIEQLKTDESLWPDNERHNVAFMLDGEISFADSYGVIDYDDFGDPALSLMLGPTNWRFLCCRPNKQARVAQAIEQNGPLLDAHSVIEKLISKLEYYADGAIFFQKADGLLTIAQEDGGQTAQEGVQEGKEALEEIEEIIDIEAGRIAHG